MVLKYAKGEVTPRTPGDNLFDFLARQVAMRGDSAVYLSHGAPNWNAVTWNAYNEGVRAAAKSLIALGLKKGQVVCILGFNRIEWVTLDLASMMAGGMSAGIYQTCAPEEIAYILNHSEAPILIVEDETYMANVAPIIAECASLKHIVMMAERDKPAGATHKIAMTWDDFIAKGVSVPDSDVDSRIADIKGHDLGGLIYTSGTTGPPKAVGLSHDTIYNICDNANAYLGLGPDDRTISYLPLSHIAEKALSIYAPLSGGQKVYFARSMETLPEDLTLVKPTLLFGVPRVWEKLQAGLSQKFAQADAKKAKTLAKAMDVGKAYFAHIRAGTKPPLGLSLKYKLYSKLVYSKVQAALGLDEMRYGFSGAAAIAKDTPMFFNGIGIQIANVYGLSENGGGATSDMPTYPIRLGSVGRPINNFEIRIADDDEIEMKGNSLFSGYVKNPEATAEALVDGWFKTGDMGYLDDDGYLFITGRKKDLIITSGGKNITPSNLETEMMSLPFVEHAVAVGDGFHFLSALITLDLAACKQGLGLEGDYKTVAESALVRDALRAGLETVNANHARVSQIREFRILPEPLSIDAGYLTPTMKVKRAKIIAGYQDLVDDIYGKK